MTKSRQDEAQQIRDLVVAGSAADDVKGGRDQVEEPTNFSEGADSENPNPPPAPAYDAGPGGTLHGIISGAGRVLDSMIPRF